MIPDSLPTQVHEGDWCPADPQARWRAKSALLLHQVTSNKAPAYNREYILFRIQIVPFFRPISSHNQRIYSTEQNSNSNRPWVNSSPICPIQPLIPWLECRVDPIMMIGDISCFLSLTFHLNPGQASLKFDNNDILLSSSVTESLFNDNGATSPVPLFSFPL